MSDIGASSGWFFYPHLQPQPRLRLFCLPYAGGGAAFFTPWLKKVPPGVEVWPIQLPGRQNRGTEPPFRRLSTLVQELAPLLEPYLDVPSAFFGHSMGALISFELARQLRRMHAPLPQHLFLAGRRAPHLIKNRMNGYQLEDAAFLQVIASLNYFSSSLLAQREMTQTMLPTLKADFELVETYEYADETPLDCEMSVFGGVEDLSVQTEELLAWQQQTTRPFHFALFPGDHFFIHTNQTSLLRTLLRTLAHDDSNPSVIN